MFNGVTTSSHDAPLLVCFVLTDPEAKITQQQNLLKRWSGSSQLTDGSLTSDRHEAAARDPERRPDVCPGACVPVTLDYEEQLKHSMSRVGTCRPEYFFHPRSDFILLYISNDESRSDESEAKEKQQ